MKTGRRRKKEPGQESPKPPSFQPPAPPSRPTRSTQSRQRKGLLLPILIGLVVLVVGSLVCGRSCFGPKATPSTYLPATATGSWTTTVRLVEQADDTEQIVDDYDEYAYNIYYEETEDELYEAAGDSFAVTQLNEKEDWWEGNRHYVAKEWLDKETCQYTEYTVWITDPENEDYEIEVVLSECEVWDHVVVTEKQGSQGFQDTLTRQGTGTTVEWPEAIAPAGVRMEHEFEGAVVFRADGAKRTVKVTDVDTYIRYLTVPYYLGLDEKGNVVDLTDKAP